VRCIGEWGTKVTAVDLISPGSFEEGDDDEVGERRCRLQEGGARSDVGDDAAHAQRKRQRHGSGDDSDVHFFI